MRSLTTIEMKCISGGNGLLIAAATLFGSVLILNLAVCARRRYCGYKPYVQDDTYFFYKWSCD